MNSLRAGAEYGKGSQTHTAPLDSWIAGASQRSKTKAKFNPGPISKTEKELEK